MKALGILHVPEAETSHRRCVERPIVVMAKTNSANRKNFIVFEKANRQLRPASRRILSEIRLSLPSHEPVAVSRPAAN
jgi:hypothetical protein